MPKPQSVVLEHEKLSVYHKSLDFSSLVAVLAKSWPQGKAYLLDQLLRASTSIVLNIAEGAGEFAPKEKARFYRYALRSATECAAILDVGIRHEALTEEDRVNGRAVLIELVAMLTRLSGNLASQRSEPWKPVPPAAKAPVVIHAIGIPRPQAPLPPRKTEPFGGRTA